MSKFGPVRPVKRLAWLGVVGVLLAVLAVLAGCSGAAAERLWAGTQCRAFLQIESADTARGADRVAETADAGALLRLVRPVLPAGVSPPAGARATIAGAVRWCTAHPGGRLGAAVANAPAPAAAAVGSIDREGMGDREGVGDREGAEAGATQAAWLFARACLAGAGQADALRAWAGRHRLRLLPPRLVAGFAGAGRPAQVFDAGTRAGKMVLVSADDGACQVVMERGTQDAAEAAMARVLGRVGVTIAPVFGKVDHGTAVALRLYRAAADGHGWLVSVDSTGDRTRLGPMAQVRLSAVVDPALGE